VKKEKKRGNKKMSAHTLKFLKRKIKIELYKRNKLKRKKNKKVKREKRGKT
jgi:hypothetical protein